ncbi:RNA polymerase sigma-70 factor [Puteibacter caeruleilacunae]|nr:RNA polymerase sigma-70 factor [Puteibacter caeruleilacunae]
MNTESEILQLIAEQSDEKAFRQLFDMYNSRLYYFALTFVKNKELAEEIVSDVFFKLWVHRQTLGNLYELKPYLFTATKNTSLNYLEKEARAKAKSLEDLSIVIIKDKICPETELITKELSEKITDAIDQLPDRCKLIYNMAKVERLKYKEIGKILGLSPKTVENQVAIAIKKIAEEVNDYLNSSDSEITQLILFQLLSPNIN